MSSAVDIYVIEQLPAPLPMGSKGTGKGTDPRHPTLASPYRPCFCTTAEMALLLASSAASISPGHISPSLPLHRRQLASAGAPQ